MWFISPGNRPAPNPADPEKLEQPVENPAKIDKDSIKLRYDDCILDQYIISVSETKIFTGSQDTFKGYNAVFFYHSR